jgi:hypothetical protein
VRRKLVIGIRDEAWRLVGSIWISSVVQLE